MQENQKKNHQFKQVKEPFIQLFNFFKQAVHARLVNILFVFLAGVPFFGLIEWFAERRANPQQFAGLMESFWWALVTMTTVGYGDKFPITFLGRVVGSFTMIYGMTSFALVSARIVSFIIERNLWEGSGLAKLTGTFNHYIICGWKQNMPEVVQNILDYNAKLKPENLVIVANVEAETFRTTLQSIPRFEKVKFVKGDAFSEDVLKRANIKECQNCLVLPSDYQNMSVREIDNQTVMTVMTIKTLNKKTSICAELIDSQFEKFIKLAGCDEIIHSQKEASKFIGNVFSQPGLTKVVSNLLASHPVATDRLEIKIYPEKYLMQPFQELKTYYQDQGHLLIGVLENTGNAYDMKHEAIREAQKTPDISKLIDNLRATKGLETNVPVFNPSPSYRLPKYSKAIVISSQSLAEGPKI